MNKLHGALVGLFVAGCVAQAGTGFPSNGLVAYYPFNGNSQDASGRGCHAQSFGAPVFTYDRMGCLNSAYALDGLDDYIETPVVNSFTALTMSVWVKMKSDPPLRKVIMGAGWWFKDNYIGVNNWELDNKFSVWSGGCGWNCLSELTAPSIYNLDQWYHVAMVHTGTRLFLYVNGMLLTSRDASLPKDSRCIRIGSSSCITPADGNCQENVHADVDDACIYNRALSATEVAQLYEYCPKNEEPQVSVIGFSTEPDGERDVTEFYRSEICHIRVKDVGLALRSKKARVFAQGVQGLRRKTILLEADVNDGSFRGALPLSSFRAGPVTVTVLGVERDVQLYRNGQINVR